MDVDCIPLSVAAPVAVAGLTWLGIFWRRIQVLEDRTQKALEDAEHRIQRFTDEAIRDARNQR